MDTSTFSRATGVSVPTHELISGGLLRQLEHAASVAATSTDDAGEFFSLLAKVLPATEVESGAIVIVPLASPADNEVLDFTFVAQAKAMFVTIFETPQSSNTYGHVASYSTGTVDKPVSSGHARDVRKWRLVYAIRDSEGAEVDLPTDPSLLAVGKRFRRPVTGGESGEDAEERPKGTYRLDLDDVKHFTRNKSDLAQREKELNIIFRAMESQRRDFATSSDFILQTEVYRSMINEQGDTPTGDRHEAFESCGILGRVPLPLSQKKEKLKALLTGFVFVECTTETTLTLDDSVVGHGDKISNRAFACPLSNVGLLQALKNFQTVMQIVFSDVFAKSLDIFIDHLEGLKRPMDAVAADFLRYCVEQALRKFFWIIRSV
jgi:hypothetical protein